MGYQNGHMTDDVKTRDPDIFRCEYLKTVRDKGSVPMDNQ